MAEYLEIPVATAKSIAEEFRKSAVVILAWDSEHQLTHTTTYGVNAFDKENAAAAGEKCSAAIGCDLGAKQTFEDFHNDYDPGFLREAEEVFKLIRNRQGVTAPQLQQIERWLKARGHAMRQG